MSQKGEELSREYREELTRKYREAVASHLGGEQLEAVGPFWRAGWLGGEGEEPGPLSIRGALDARQVARGQRLPPKFLLAATKKRVHVFSYSVEFSGDLVGTPTVGEEVASFARGDLRFFRQKRSMLLGLPSMLLGGPTEVVTLRVTRGEQTEDVGIDVTKLDENPLAIEVYAALSQ
ncbi:MAG: hypothetical protein WA701_00625 [Solirubrobacterales bacterium]